MASFRCLALLLAVEAACAQDPVQHVNILGGTYSRFDYGTGSLLPFVGRPWGMNNWAIQTNNYAGSKLGPLTHWWFHPEDRELYGFRCTHQASPWIYDYGEFLLTPSIGPLASNWPDKATAYNRSSAEFGPDITNVTMQGYCTGREADGGCLTAAITATERAAMLTLNFPPAQSQDGWDQTRHLRTLVGRDGSWLWDSFEVGQDKRSFSGFTRANSGGVPTVLSPASLEVLTRIGAYRAQSCSSGHSGFNLSHSVTLQGPDLSSIPTPAGLDPVSSCLAACTSNHKCAGFLVDLNQQPPVTCSLKARLELSTASSDSRAVVGWNVSEQLYVQQPQFAHYFYGELDAELSSSVVQQVNDNMYTLGLEGVLSFDSSLQQLNVRIGTSFISLEQAKRNLAAEIPRGTSFRQLRSSNREAWNSLLSKTTLEQGSNSTAAQGLEQLGTWYSNLYRASIFPRMLFEYDAGQSPIHYSPYTGRVHSGRLSSDSGFWDAYRTVYPLNSLLRADQMAIQMEGWINAYSESGHIPGWAAPGDRGAMTGNMQDASVADAIVKGIRGFDHDLAYRALMEDAFEVVPSEELRATGRRKGLGEYIELGYLPSGKGIGDEVSATLNYALADFSMSLASRARGDAANATVLLARSRRAWRALWDGDTRGGFMRSKNAQGVFDEPFDEFAWQGQSGEYTEAAAWQYRFYVPHEPVALAEAYSAAGGNQSAMCGYLVETMTGERKGGRGVGSTFHNGAWGLHHEQVEMVENCWGQYEHNNQPVWHMLYMFAPAGCASDGQYWLRQATSRLYRPDFFSGDEDNGSMSSWFVLSAMGVYQLVPGDKNYSIGSPLYQSLKIDLDNGNQLRILAEGNSAATPYVKSVKLNGVQLAGLKVGYDQLRAGGTLEFEMSSTPSSSFA